MKTLKILSWESPHTPLKNENDWPRKGFEIRLRKCVTSEKSVLKRLLKGITNKELVEIPINTKINEEILSLADHLTMHGAKFEITDN